MTLTTEFPGSSLPAGWTFSSALGTGSAAVANGRLTLTAPSGTSYDSISAGSGVNNAICIAHALGGGDVDIAIQVDKDNGDLKSVGYTLLITDGAGGWGRFALTHPNDNSERPNFFGASRPTGSGTGSGGTNHYNTHVNNPPASLQSGTPAWLRLKFTLATGVFQPYYSTDGVTWVTYTPFTRAIGPPTQVLIGLTRTAPTATGGSIEVGQVVDVLAAGTTDLRAPVIARKRTLLAELTGTDGALPAEWEDDSVGGDSISWTGAALRFASDAANVGSYARIKYLGTKVPEWEVLLRAQAVTFSGSLFATFAGTTDVGGSGIDVYVRGAGYGLEIGNTARRPIRVDDPTGSDVASVPGSTGLDEKPYCWLLDTTGTQLSTGAPTRMWRFQRIGRRFRVREWADQGSLAASLAAEPTTWMFDGQDEIERQDAGPVLVLSHNNPVGGLTGTGQFDVLYLGFWGLSAYTPQASGTATIAASAHASARRRRRLAGAALVAASGTARARRLRRSTGTAALATSATGAARANRRVAGTAMVASTATGVARRLRRVAGTSAAAVWASAAPSIARILRPRLVAASPVQELWRVDPVRSALGTTPRLQQASVEQLHHVVSTPTEPTSFDLEHTFVLATSDGLPDDAAWGEGEWGDPEQTSAGSWRTAVITPSVGPGTPYELERGEWLCFARIGGVGGVIKFAGSFYVA